MKKVIQFLVKVLLFMVGVFAIQNAIEVLGSGVGVWLGFWKVMSLFGGVLFMIPLIQTVERFIKE